MAPAGAQADLDAELVLERDGFALDITLRVAAGTTAALLGPNGAGKSTTVAAIAGLLAVRAGQVTIGERRLDDPSAGLFVPAEQRRIGVVFQHYLLFDHLTVRDNVAFGPRSAGLSRRRAREVADIWLARLDLVALADRRPRQLSGGQAQRVGLARALAVDPAVLLLDEPLAALDLEVRRDLRRFLATHLDGFPGPRLIITHDPTDAILLADHIHIIEGGRITQTGTPEEIRRRPATPYAAALVGTNLLHGTSRHGTITLDAGGAGPSHLHAADTSIEGPVLVTIHPAAISLYPEEPHGSPRNTWHSRVATIEALGDTVRVTLAGPVLVAADITPGAAAALQLAVGQQVWAVVKATEVTINPA
jgi:molybdate transport system ATP-binding protein